jgi:glycosyltransferase involved in cell wall biosynthesis
MFRIKPASKVFSRAPSLHCAAEGEKGVPETIRHGETSFPVALGDVECLRKCLIHLAETPRDRRKMGQAARRWVEQRFSQEAWRKEYHDLLYALAHSGVAHSGRQTASARE